ncbi:N-acetylglucosaminyl-phosphatidylinositol de-N-acetylase [Orbilia brochopaga]|uniref:N-acetylglucosaminylphosphatidylinositol deacetylase n=1 Tax=Orbilia brochopaga TaxID=3140254 RepID=A0AAV9UZD5_9PEZI
MPRLRSPRRLALLLLPVLLAAICYHTLTAIAGYEPLRNRSIALLIAHPDDEAMFFAPTLQALTHPSANNKLHIICFSIGNAAGIGAIRQSELLASAALLGVANVNDTVAVHDHPRLPDSMSTVWPEDLVASLLSDSLASFSSGGGGRPVDTLVTFDSHGVSGHPNHVSLLAGARYFVQHYPGQQDVLLYTLTSVPIYRKYISALDAFVTTILYGRTGSEEGEGRVVQNVVEAHVDGAPRKAIYLSGWSAYRAAQRAMTEGHKSQMVWFRWGWITLSRYMVFNDLVLDTRKV